MPAAPSPAAPKRSVKVQAGATKAVASTQAASAPTTSASKRASSRASAAAMKREPSRAARAAATSPKVTDKTQEPKPGTAKAAPIRPTAGASRATGQARAVRPAAKAQTRRAPAPKPEPQKPVLAGWRALDRSDERPVTAVQSAPAGKAPASTAQARAGLKTATKSPNVTALVQGELPIGRASTQGNRASTKRAG
jgi:hypothetical protein